MQKDKVLPIVLTCDDGYVKYTSVLITSLIANRSKQCRYEITILSEQISEENQQLLKEQVAPFEGISLQFRFLIDFDASKFFLNAGAYQTVSTWYRFYIPELFPEYDRILYMDCDITINGDLSPLADMDFEGKAILSVRDEHIVHEFLKGNSPEYPRAYFLETLKMKDPTKYFNAGVICFNLKKIREEKIAPHFFEILEEVKTPIQQDQDILNSVFSRYGGVKLISFKYNYMESYGRKNILRDGLKKLLGKKDGIVTFHYAWHNKAWHPDKNKGFLYFNRKVYFYKYLLSPITPEHFRREIFEQNKTDITPLERFLARHLV